MQLRRHSRGGKHLRALRCGHPQEVECHPHGTAVLPRPLQHGPSAFPQAPALGVNGSGCPGAGGGIGGTGTKEVPTCTHHR